MKSNKVLIITTIICLLPMILGIAVYDKLPEQMPIHFTFNDVPDNYGPKNFALFALPMLMAALNVFCCLAMRYRLKKDNLLNNEKLPKLMKILEWIFPIITIIVYLLMILYALGFKVYIGKIVSFTVGCIFLFMGNYMPKMNYEVGRHISNPSMKSEEAFRKMTKIMGYGYIFLGIVFIALVFFV